MKYSSILISICLCSLLFSCDPSGNIFITNNYPYDITLEISYENQGSIITSETPLNKGVTFVPDAMGHNEYTNIIEIIINDNMGNQIAKYSKESIKNQAENILRTKNSIHFVLSENGLAIN